MLHELPLSTEVLSADSSDPYVVVRTTVERTECFWNEAFDQDAICECGDPYYRHFDTYEKMSPVGCKYCDCYTFRLPK